ncbi:MAG: SpoIID/LytB domain-containing protein, partial [Oscillospiraceae bacterium]
VYGDFSSNQLHRNYVLFGSYDLSKFLSQAFYNEDLIFNFDTINAAEHWKVFSAFKLSTLPFDIKLTSFNDDIEYFSYITNLISSSQVSLDTTISANDPIAILVNEGSDGTTVVAAKMIPEDFSKNNTIELEEPIVSLPEPFDLSSSNLISSIISSLFNPSLPQPESKPTMPSSPVTSATPPPPSDDADDKILTVSNNLNGGERVSGKASDILPMIIEAEMGSHFHIEALKAQAVSAYSWLLNNGSDKNKYPSLPMKTAGARAKEAVNAVLGKTVTFGGRTVSTYFCAMSAGKTASVQDIWGGNAYPYLQSVDSSADIGLPNWETTRTYKASDVSLWLDEMGINNKSENKNEWFKTEYDKNGIYCTYVTIGTERNKGTFLRDKLFTAARVGSSNVLRSSAYRISYNSSQDTFTFVVKGYGHGVGMSQYAARVYADSGWSYEKILKHYFPGVSIE